MASQQGVARPPPPRENRPREAAALEQVARILEGISDACVVLDRAWTYVYLNERAGRLFGRRPEDLVGKNIWEEFPEGIDQEFYRAYVRAIESQQPEQIEAYYPPWARWFENRIYPSPDGLVILFQDVTERHANERERLQLARVLEATRDIVIVCDVDGRVCFGNRAATEQLRMSAIDGTGANTLVDLHASRARAQLRDEAIPEAERCGLWRGETVLEQSDGREMLALASLVYEAPAAGQPGFLALVARDITERKRAEERSRDEARVRAKAERMAHLGLWDWDLASNHVTWSEELYRIYGLDEKTFGASFEAYLDRVHPDDRSRVRATIETALRARSNVTFDERIVRPDGETRYLHSWGAAKFGEQGDLAGLVGACLDMTDLFQATTALRRKEEWLRMALEAAEIGLWEWDRARGTVLWSPGVESIFGLEPGTFAGTYEAYLELIHPEDRPRLEAAIRAAVEKGVEYEVLHRVVEPGGAIRWVEGRGRVIPDEHGVVIRMAGSVADVTERHAIEERLRQSQKMEAIGRLAAGVAHDFNNLLTVILTMSEVMSSRAGIDEAVRTGVNEIVGAARRASDLTKQLVTLSRPQLPSVATLDVNTIVESSATMLKRLLPEDIRLVTDPTPEPCAVRGDRTQIEQIMLNLVVNARDAMPDGGEIHVATHRLAAGASDRSGSTEKTGPRVVLSVSDTGTGMSAETRARLFEPFFTTKPEGKGSGLGLSMVYGIVRQMGGTIDVDTALGRGSTFTITLPAEPASLLTSTSEAAEPTRAHGETVLLVDDQESIRRTVGMLLSDMGYRVIEAPDGERAIQTLESPSTGKVDLLLTDVGMPRMDGVDLATRVRTAHPHIAVIFMSGYADRPIEKVPGESTAAVSKPFTQTELSAAIRKVLAARTA